MVRFEAVQDWFGSIEPFIKGCKVCGLRLKNSLSLEQAVKELHNRGGDLLSRSLKLSPSESHIFKTVSQEICPSDGMSCHIAADGRRPCEGARRCQDFIDRVSPLARDLVSGVGLRVYLASRSLKL